MSEENQPKRRPKLPPISLEAPGESTTDEPTRRRRKKPAPSQDLGTDEDSPGRRPAPPRRPRSDSRSRPSGEGEGEGGGRGSSRGRASQSPAPPRDSTRRPRSRPQTAPKDVAASPSPRTADDSDAEPTTKPRPKRKPKAPRTESKEELVGNGRRSMDRASASQPAKKKRKRKPRAQEAHDGPMAVGLEAELQELEEDVVAAENSDDSVDDNKYAVPVMRSEPVNKLFIEQRSGFKTTNKAKVAQKRAEQQRRAMEPPTPPRTKNTIQFAISSHRGVQTFILFLQGLLGGISIWQVVTVYLLSNQGYDVLLSQYYKLALPVQCIYYFMFALSTVSVFDRNDIARPTRRFVLRSVAMQTSAISCFFYFFGLVVSLSIARTDDKIGLFVKQPELWADPEARDAELSTWVILNLVRGLMPPLGWFVMSLRPTSDRLVKNLEKADENILEVEGSVINAEANQANGV